MSNEDRRSRAGVKKKGAPRISRALPSLASYRALIAKLDSYGERLRRRYGKHLACREGCSGCCSLGSVFAVEAFSMYLSAVSLPGSKMLALRDGAGPGTRAGGGPDRCPLLLDDRCLLYDARPVICRTHGYPLLVEGRVDHCPKNFTSLRTIESNLILDLDAINTILAGVNIAFMKENGDRRFSRVRIGVPDLLNMLGP